MSAEKESLTYRAAGVDIDAGEEVVERIKPLVARTFRKEVMAGLGGFGALFELAGRYKDPVLVSGTDGVGTKLKLAQTLNRHDTIGSGQQALGKGASSRSDFDYQGLAPRAGRGRDTFQDRSLDEEMLAEFLPGHSGVSP